MWSGVLYSPSKVEQEQKIHYLSIYEGGSSISFFFSQWFGILLRDKRSKKKKKILHMVGEALCQYINIEKRSIYFSIRI